MNYYPLGALVSFILFGMGLFAVIRGAENYYENKASKSGFQMLLVCLSVFFWDFGYAWMGLCYDSDFAYFPRAAALLAVYLYVFFIMKYVSIITNYSTKKLNIFSIIFVLLTVFSWPRIIGKNAVEFASTPWGYWFYSKMSIGRMVQFLCIILGITQYIVIVRRGIKNAETKREKYVLRQYYLFVPILFTGYTFDVLLPILFKIPAVPGSAIAAFIAAMLLLNTARINKLLGVTKDNVSKNVFDDVKVPVIITDNKDRIVLCNEYTYEFLGFSEEEIKNHKLAEFLESGEDKTMIVKGQEKECVLENTEIIDQFGERLYIIHFVSDVTEERKSYRLMQESKEEAEEANRAKSDFLANMSHEIRTPMSAIIGMSQIITERNDISDSVKSQANEIKIAGTNLLAIINDILDVSKIESGKFELVPDDFDIAVLIHEISSIIDARLAHSDVGFVVDVDPTIPRELVGDVGRIRQILMNILGNAIKFTKTGHIAFKVTWNKFIDAPDIMIDVSDTGMGIKPEDLDNIFGKYYQADIRKNRNIQGTGLGLAISRNLAILMGGMITVDSVYGEGSTFHIVLCLEIANKYKEIGDETAKQLREKTFVMPIKEEIIAKDKSNMKVLVVDDSKVNLLVATGLMKKYNMTVDTALSGKESIEKVKETDYDIVFMDHMMPEMDGVEAMKNIRELGDKYEKLPIVALTANAINDSKTQLLGEGFDDFLAKPISLVELDRVINQWG